MQLNELLGASVLSEGLEFWENCDVEDVQNLVFNDGELELHKDQVDELCFKITLTNPRTGVELWLDELDYEELTDMIIAVELVKVEPEEDSE